MSIFGDLFQSDIEKLVESATTEFRTEPDWSANAKIWDAVNKNPDAAKDVIKLIRKRINHKVFNVASLTLTLFEAIIKNSGPYFRELVEKKETLDALLAASRHASTRVREQALTIILSLAEINATNGRFANYKQAYENMKAAGIQFPARDMNALAPFNTPPSRGYQPPTMHSIPNTSTSSTSSISSAQPVHSSVSSTQSTVQRAGPVASTPQYTHPFCSVSKEFSFKVKSEMEITLNYLSIIKETIDALAAPAGSGSSSSSSASALKNDSSLTASVKMLTEIRSRLARLMAEIDDDLILDVALQVNEAVRSVQEYYKDRSTNPLKKVESPVIRVPDAMKVLEKRALGKDGKEEEEQKQKREEERRNSAAAVAAANRSQATAQPQPQQQPAPSPHGPGPSAASSAPARGGEVSPVPAAAKAAAPPSSSSDLLDFFGAPVAASSSSSSSSSAPQASRADDDPFAQLARRADNSSSPTAATGASAAPSASSSSLLDIFGSNYVVTGGSGSAANNNKNLSTVQTSQVHVSNDELADLLSLTNTPATK